MDQSPQVKYVTPVPEVRVAKINVSLKLAFQLALVLIMAYIIIALIMIVVSFVLGLIGVAIASGVDQPTSSKTTKPTSTGSTL